VKKVKVRKVGPVRLTSSGAALYNPSCGGIGVKVKIGS
jgi:hypothetical protein